MSQQPTLFGRVPDTVTLNALAVEKDRTLSNKSKVLLYLQEHGSATNAQLTEIGGMRYGARIRELRQDGHIITVERVSGGLFRVTLEGA